MLALGKMGAFELNYSSDIDLMVFYEPEAAPEDTPPVQYFVRITRGLIKLLQERTADGYVFRVDLRLRPDPGSTQIAVSIPAALDYYERSGQNWERSAMIKARPCAGDIAEGEAFLKSLSPFVWRKNLDYAALADVHAMKQQIHAYRGHGDIAVEGHNIKLGRGGIREIEFFVQTQQLIAGGRHPDLRGRETLAMLKELERGGWIKEETRKDLDEAYHFLRGVEHRLQMVADEQTHTLPEDREALEQFSRFLGYRTRDAFAKELVEHLQIVQQHYAALFETRTVNIAAERELNTSGDGELAANAQYFAGRGFARAPEAADLVQTWFSGSYRSLKGETARGTLADILPHFIDHAVRSENPDAALLALDRFLAALHAGSSLFLQLRQNQDLVTLLATILSVAPRLGDILAAQPSVMDSLLEPAFFGALPNRDQLEKTLARTFGQSETFEDLLDRARMFGREHMFLIGVRIISGTVSAKQAGEVYAALADVLIRAMRKAAEDRFVADHGKLKKQEAAVLALGKLGGREMTAGSDLDLMVVYDFDDDVPESDGKRKLAGQPVFRAVDPAHHQCAHRAHQLRSALSRRYAAAAVRQFRAGGDIARGLQPLPARGSVDLGAHGTDAGAGRVGVAGVHRADRKDDPRCAVPAAGRGRHRRRYRRDAPRGGDRAWRFGPLEHQERRRRAARCGVSGAVSSTRSRQGPPGHSPDRHDPSAGEGGGAQSAGAGRRGTSARGGAALSGSHANSAALRQRRFRSVEIERRFAAPAGARSGPSRFHDAGTVSDRYAEAGARVLRADIEGVVVELIRGKRCRLRTRLRASRSNASRSMGGHMLRDALL